MLRSPNRSSSETDIQSVPEPARPVLTDYINTRKRGHGDHEALTDMRNEIMRNFSLLQGDQIKINEAMVQIMEQNKEIINANTNIVKALENTTSLCNDLNSKVEIITASHQQALNKINKLEEQLEEIQRNQRAATLEIRNIPETEKENLEATVEKIHTSIGIAFSEVQIRQIYRIKSAPSKPIIVEYQTAKTRNEVLKAIKSYNATNNRNKYNTKTLNLPGDSKPIFFSESLTPSARKLHFLGRDLQKNHGFKYCWISKGKIFVRKMDGAEYPAVEIKNIQQVEEMRKNTVSSVSN